MEKEIIREFFKDIREFQKNVLERTNNLYQISFIHYNKKDNTTKKFTIQQPFRPNKLTNVIFNNKLYYKNRQKFENIYINLYKENTKTNLLWLDDIKLSNFTEEQLKYITLLETSPNNYQGYILLNKEVNKEELKLIKKYFVKFYGTDGGSIDFTHLMRLPYFFSFKRKDPFLVTIKKYQQKVLPVDTLLQKLKKQQQKGNKNLENISQKKDLKNVSEKELKKIYEKYLKTKEEEKIKLDNNVLDYRFIHFLYLNNINIFTIDFKNILHDLGNRKKGHISDYIERTINKVTKNFLEYQNFDYELLKEIFNN